MTLKVQKCLHILQIVESADETKAAVDHLKLMLLVLLVSPEQGENRAQRKRGMG